MAGKQHANQRMLSVGLCNREERSSSGFRRSENINVRSTYVLIRTTYLVMNNVTYFMCVEYFTQNPILF